MSGERERWNDQAVDVLEGRVNAHRNELDRLDRQARDDRDLDLERVRSVRADLAIVAAKVDNLADIVTGRFDKVDEDHELTMTNQAALNAKVKNATGVNWQTVLTILVFVVVPIVVAIITRG